MAIYHFEAKIISRGTGRSAVAASAYLACSYLYNEYDGIQHDYRRKQGLVYQEVMLPEYAPETWHDREKLWNEVELTESTKDSRLAREIVLALPVELDKHANLELLRSFVQEAFVDSGMCADYAIHDTDGHNPHAHVMLTVRPLNEDGTWQYKTEKEYLCIRDGEEEGFTAEEFKKASVEGWEKQYQYKKGRKKVYMTPSEAEKEGVKRIDKHPKATRFGRQNPITARWNSEEQLISWRSQWANAVNRALEHAKKAERIDHRSNKDRGIDEQPTIHEGVASHFMEMKGIRTERSELNRQIREDNKALRELKATISRLLKAAKEKLSLPAIAEAMDKLRTRMIETLFYHMRNENKVQEIEEDINMWEPDVKRYFEIGGEIKAKKEKREQITQTRKETSLLAPFERHDLKKQETTLTEEIEELKSERKGILSRHHMSDREGMKNARTIIASWKKNKKKIEEHNKKLAAGIEKDEREHLALRNSVSPEDRPRLDRMCAEMYQSDKYNRRDRVQAKLSSEFDNDIYWQSEEQVDERLGIDSRMEAHVKSELDLKREIERVKNQPVRTRSKSRGMEI
ncbi:MAG: MobA/MobL family protein [Lachnospiraceae bacterium]|nr:MobA/MobL family protein [Lachnospiraceae bacterium]